MSDPRVLVLAGATASGKTQLAMELALHFDAEIVGADSRQIYRDMPIGTAMPAPEQRALVPHHLVDFLDPAQRYSAARYAADARDAIAEIHSRGKRAIVVGGTGFYLRALTGGVALAPQYDEGLRERLAREARRHPPEFLHDWLRLREPVRAAAIHPGDTYRVLRALELALTQRRHPELVDRQPPSMQWLKLFLDVPIETIDARIARRTRWMLENGLIEEAERVGEGAVAANAVGYPQALAYLRGWSTRKELLQTLESATRRYARRQRTWFRHEPEVVWMPLEAVAPAVREKLGWSANR